MPAAAGTPVVGKMSSRVLNMKFMQRGNKAKTPSKETSNIENTENELDKAHVKDVSEWSFKSPDKIKLLHALKNKNLKNRVSKGPSTISQTILNEKYNNVQNSEGSTIGRKEFGKKDELDKELESMAGANAVDENRKEKDLAEIFKESNDSNKKSKKRKIDNVNDESYSGMAKKPKN
ncbi:hypothetical protein QEN19_003698 [Hanseniaspora menglaensis]